MTSPSAALNARPSKLWLLLAVLMTIGSLALLAPASFLLSRVLPERVQLLDATGNLLSGSAVVQPAAWQSQTMRVQWSLSPAYFLLARLQVRFELESGQSVATGQWSRSPFAGRVSQLNATLYPDFVSKLGGGLKLSGSPLELSEIGFKKGGQFSDATGSLNWQGGEFQQGGSTAQIKPLSGEFTTSDDGALLLAASNNAGTEVMRMTLSADGLLDLSVKPAAYELEGAGSAAGLTYSQPLWSSAS